MTCKLFFTCGKKKMKNKKKKPHKCYIRDFTGSIGLGGNHEESSFYKNGI